MPLIRIESSYPKGPLSADVRGDADNDRGRAGAGGGRSGGGRSAKLSKNGKDRRRKPGGLVDYDEVLPHFREATWEEALDLVARRLTEIHAEQGAGAIAGFGSAKCSNEEAYLFQKLIRAGFGTNNVDHCTRLCHASSVAALFEGVGSGAVSTTYGDVANAEVVIITGSNPTANHPVASSFFKQARRRGTKIIYVDPRANTVAEHADYHCQVKPGTDVAFYNGIMHEVIRLGLIDLEFVKARVSGFEELVRTVNEYPPERAAQITGVDADLIREVARVWGEAKAGVVYWGMGISQHTTGTDNARCLIALCSITGNVGRPGTGLHPLRGQNNVQGASDAGLIPMFFPDYQGVDLDATRRRFEEAWGTELDPNRGLTVTEIIGSVLKPGGVRGMYMLGENPFLSDPNINKVRKALSQLDFLVVQDIFLTETAEFADVILPASSYLEKEGSYTNTDRRVQLGRKVLDPPGQARVDWEIIQDLAQRIGLDWSYSSPSEVFDEMVALMPSYANLRHDNLGLTGKLYPNDDPEHSDGTVVLFDERFNTDDGLAHLVPAQWLPAKELPDGEYPLVLNTGRLLEHWHTGSMTRRSYALDAIAPIAEVYMHPKDAADRGLSHGQRARVRSRRGAIELQVRVSHREQLGNCFIPFHFREAAANLLTIDEIDPVRQDPRVQVLRDSGRGVERRGAPQRYGKCLNDHEFRAGTSPGARCGGTSREVPRAVADPRAQRHPGAAGLVAARGAGGAGPRPCGGRSTRSRASISFYPHFRTTPPAKVAVSVCHDLSCWLRSADDRIAEVRDRYGDDTEIELVEVSCLGRCDSAPALAVNEHPAPVADVDALVAAAREEELGEAVVTPRAEPWPNDPYPAGSDVSDRYATCVRCWPAS